MVEKLEAFLVIRKVKSTVFFIRQRGDLKQGIDIVVENKKNPTRGI